MDSRRQLLEIGSLARDLQTRWCPAKVADGCGQIHCSVKVKLVSILNNVG